jgi:hypothetical protein
MTAIIAFDLGACALRVADTRRTTTDANGPPQDGEQKIFRAPFGMIAGAGTRGMITAVARRVNDRNLPLHELNYAMEAYRRPAKTQFPGMGAVAMNSLNQTLTVATRVESAYSGVAIPTVAAFRGFPHGIEREDVGTGRVAIYGPSRDPALQDWTERCRPAARP